MRSTTICSFKACIRTIFSASQKKTQVFMFTDFGGLERNYRPPNYIIPMFPSMVESSCELAVYDVC